MILASLALSVLAGPPPGASPAESAGESWGPVHPLWREVSQGEADRLLAYAWDDRPWTPSAFRSGRPRLDYGEAWPTADTALLLTFNEGEGVGLADACGSGRGISVDGTGWGEGRFGPGLELGGAGASVRIGDADEPLLGDNWTIELWVRPDPELGGAGEAERTLLSSPDGLRLVRHADGTTEARFEAGPGFVVRTPVRLRSGIWNHVGLVLDGPELQQARLVVNGRPSVALRPEGFAWAGADGLILGDPGDGSGLACTVDDLRVRRHAMTTAELQESHAAGAAVGEHSLRLRYASGEREAHAWAGVLVEPDPGSGSGAGLAGGLLEHVVAGEGGLRWAEGHWERARTPAPPLARTTHPTVFVGDHTAFVFGGETRDTHLGPMVNTADTWLFDMQGRRWREVHTEAAPGRSCHQAAAYSPDHDLVLYPGGVVIERQPYLQYDTTWVYHVSEERWEERHPSGIELPTLSGCTVVYHEAQRVFIVMATLPRGIFAYDPERDRWSQLPTPTLLIEHGVMPPDSVGFPGSSVNAAYEPVTESILMFGGESWPRGEQTFQGTTALYHPSTNIIVVRDPVPAPAPRVRSGFAFDSLRERYVLFGGVLDEHSERMADLWSYRVETNQWTRHEASNTPSARGGYYGMAFDPELDRFALLCGRSTPMRFLNEAWLLHLDPLSIGTATYVFDRAGFGERESFHASWRTPGESAVELAFRGSEDCGDWSDWEDDPEACVGSRTRFVMVRLVLRPDPEAGPPEILGFGFGEAGDAPPEEAEGVVRRRYSVPRLR